MVSRKLQKLGRRYGSSDKTANYYTQLWLPRDLKFPTFDACTKSTREIF